MRIYKRITIFKCDRCGKESKPLYANDNPEPIVETPKELRGWIIGANIFNEDRYSREYRDYCSKSCIKKAIDDYYE